MRDFSFALLLILFSTRLFSQSVVVSSYFNASDPRDEWTELIVVTDNTDMRNWSIRDNNSSQTTWQVADNFNNIAFWNNMRAGTIIMIWHRPVKSDGVTAHPIDVNKNDGYIELDATNSTYFNGGAFGTAPNWGGNSLDIAGTMDIVELRDASGTHVHALSHSSAVGANWTAMASPKLNHHNNASTGDAVYVCPGDNIADYGTTAPIDATTWTSKNSGTITFGLPNISGGSPIQNTAFWDTLREPVFANQVVSPSSVIPGNPGSITFSWTAATDPNPADLTTGYLILQNTSNSFVALSDGTTYTTGALLGTATIIAQFTPSTTTTYTDNTVMNGNSYYYRVYAFRYTTDNINGNTYHRSRGRAYTSTFVDVEQVNPLPVELISFSGQKKDASVLLSWETSSELNNNYFSVERSDDDGEFSSIGIVDGNGTCSQPHFYSFTDDDPNTGENYYRLRQVDFNGREHISNIIAISFEPDNSFSADSYFNEYGLCYSTTGDSPSDILIIDMTGKIMLDEKGIAPGSGILNTGNWSDGIYLVVFSNNGRMISKKLFLGRH